MAKRKRVYKYFKEVMYGVRKRIIVLFFKMIGPPRILWFSQKMNEDILRAFGAHVGKNVIILSPITLHHSDEGYDNLAIHDNCVLNGNNYLDLAARVILEKGVSLGPNVTIMSHNRYNYNSFLEDRLVHTCGKKDVLIKEGSGIKAGALITMGVTIGKNSVIAGGAVVNRDIPDNSLAAGIPAKVIKEII